MDPVTKAAVSAAASVIPAVLEILNDDWLLESPESMSSKRHPFKRKIEELLLDDDECEQHFLGILETEGDSTRKYVVETVANYSESTFRQYFKVSRSTVERIIGIYHRHHRQPQRGRPSLTPETVTLIGLWRLVNLETFQQIGSRFSVSCSTVHDIFTDFCSTLYSSRGEFIVWPGRGKFKDIASKFESKAGVPGVIGVIDGCHIKIKRPKQSRESYLNKQDFYSVNALCTVDVDMTIIDVFAGWCGSAPSADVFRNSPLCQMLTDNPLPGSYHLVGNTAFPLSQFLMVPYWDSGMLTKKEIQFNMSLSSTKSVVDRAFALMKGKFSRLKSLDISNCSTYPEIIIAACVIHNLYIESGEWTEDEFEFGVCVVESDICVDVDDTQATAKRDKIASKCHKLESSNLNNPQTSKIYV